MICKYCGSSYEENDKFCPICGRSTNGEVEATVASPAYQSVASVNPAVEEAAKDARNNIAITSFVLGILNLLGFGLFGTNIAGIILGIFGIKSNRKGFAIAGLVMNILFIVVTAFIFILIFALIFEYGIYNEFAGEFGY